MNHIFCLVWCQSRNALVAASELSSRQRGGVSFAAPRGKVAKLVSLFLLAAASIVYASGALAQSTGNAKLDDLQSLVSKYSEPVVGSSADASVPGIPGVPVTAVPRVSSNTRATATLSKAKYGVPSPPASVSAPGTGENLSRSLARVHPGTGVDRQGIRDASGVYGDRTPSAVTGTSGGVLDRTASKAPKAPMTDQAVSRAKQTATSNSLDEGRAGTPKKEVAAGVADTPAKLPMAAATAAQAGQTNMAVTTAGDDPAPGLPPSDFTESFAETPAKDNPQATTAQDATADASSPMFALNSATPTGGFVEEPSASAGFSEYAMPMAVPVVPPPGPVATGLAVGNGGVVGAANLLLGTTESSLFTNSSGYVTDGSLQVINANFSQGYSTLNLLGLPVLNSTAVGTLLTTTGGTVLGGTGINSHLTLIGGVTSDSYIDNINNGAAGGVLGIVLPNGAPAWASTCLNVLGILKESCWALNAAQDNQVLVGDGASANGSEEVVIGTNASHTLASVDACTAFPGTSRTDPTNPCGLPTADYQAREGHSVVIGDSAAGTANAQTILGANATSDVADSVALGYGSDASRGAQTNYTAFGLATPQNSAGEVSIGSPGQERQITNVAAGSADTDAVNVAQLEGVAATADNSVQYDDASDTSVTLAGPTSTDGGVTGGTTITNLHQGNLSATSTDAVNGAQLYATDQSITNIFDSGTKYFQANSTGPGSMALGTDSVAIGTGAVANNANDVALGQGSVTALPDTGTTAFFGGAAAGTASSVLSIGSVGQERQIQNVAPGVIATSSTDAVNGSQLYSVVTGINTMGTSVANAFGGSSTYDPLTGAITTDLSYGGGNYSSVQDVINALTGGGTTPGIMYFHANSTLADSNASGTDSLAIGPVSVASGDSSVAMGNGAQASAANSLAFGAGADASMVNSIALGAGSLTLVGALTNYTAYGLTAPQTSSGELNVGNRQITGVAPGSADTDAVNVAQLEGVAATADNSVQYDDASDTSVTLAGPTSTDGGVTGGTTITNLHQGNLSATSTDAVNGAQLYATDQSITNIFDSGTKYFQANSTGPGSMALGTDSVAIGTGAVANNANDVALGQGSVTALPDTGTTAFFGGAAAGTASSVLSIGSVGQERQIQNVAPGVIATSSTDAVNGSQLYSVVTGINTMGTSVANAFGGSSTYDPLTGAITTDLSYGGGNYSSVQDVINALTGGGTTPGIMYFHANSTLADSNASGTDSLAIGPVSVASGDSSVAMGNGAQASAANSLAFGAGADASMVNSIALGAGSLTLVGALTNYTAYGLTTPQTSSGELNVGNRQITGVAAGSAPDDAVNVAQLEAVGDEAQSTDNLAVKYDSDASGNPTNTVTLIGDGSGSRVLITNVAPGAVTSASTDAINGAQLWGWTQDTSNIYSNYSLYNDLQNINPGGGGGGGSIKYFNVDSSLGDSSATGSNSVAIGPLASASGNNSVALGNGASATGDGSVAIGANSVAVRDNTVSVGSAGNDRQITNVAAGTQSTDAVNVEQMDSGMQQATNWANAYTDQRFSQLNGQIDEVGNRANAGVAAAMATAGLPQAYEPGRSMAAVAAGSFRGESSIAIGVSTISEGGRWVYKLAGSADTRGDAGVSIGAGMQW